MKKVSSIYWSTNRGISSKNIPILPILSGTFAYKSYGPSLYCFELNEKAEIHFSGIITYGVVYLQHPCISLVSNI